MVFSSMIFMWISLPVVFLLGRLIKAPRYQNILLLIASLFFYAWGEPAYFLLLLISIAMNYFIGLAIGTRPEISDPGTRRKLMLIIGIAANLGILGYYKYSNFFLNTLDHMIPGTSL